MTFRIFVKLLISCSCHAKKQLFMIINNISNEIFHGPSTAATNSETHTWYITELLYSYSQKKFPWEWSPILYQKWFLIFCCLEKWNLLLYLNCYTNDNDSNWIYSNPILIKRTAEKLRITCVFHKTNLIPRRQGWTLLLFGSYNIRIHKRPSTKKWR